MMAIGSLQGCIDSTPFLAQSKGRLPILCITRYLEIQLFFYHHPISFLINFSNSPPGGSSWKANARFLQEAKDLIKAIREASPPHMPFFTNLRKIIKFYK